MGNIGTITSTGKQNVGENQNNLKVKYVKIRIGDSNYYNKIGVLVDDSVTDRATLIDYIAQNGALGQYISNGIVTKQSRTILCFCAYYSGSSIIVPVALTIRRALDSDTQEWMGWENPIIYTRGSTSYTISTDFDVID